MYCNLYVVEGKSDVDKLTSLGCKYIYKTNGYEGLTKSKIDFLVEVNKIRNIVLVLDPDGPGKLLSSTLKKALTRYNEIRIPKVEAIKRNKVGIAESNPSLLKNSLKKYIDFDKNIQENSTVLLNEVKKLDEKVIKHLYAYYHIDTTQGVNYIYKQLNMLQITIENVKESYDEFIRSHN